MIKQIGTKIYYCRTTGNLILILGDRQGYVKETTFEEDYNTYKVLNEREKETIGLLSLPFGEYSKISKDATGVSVNVETKELVFTYDPLPEPPHEPTWRDVMEEKVANLEEVNNTQEETIATITYELMMMQTAVSIELKAGEHSPKFNMIRIWFNKGFWTADMVQDAVEHKWLTQEEANEIIGA